MERPSSALLPATQSTRPRMGRPLAVRDQPGRDQVAPQSRVVTASRTSPPHEAPMNHPQVTRACMSLGRQTSWQSSTTAKIMHMVVASFGVSDSPARTGSALRRPRWRQGQRRCQFRRHRHRPSRRPFDPRRRREDDMMRSNIFATSEGLPDETTYPPRSLISSFVLTMTLRHGAVDYREGRIRLVAGDRADLHLLCASYQSTADVCCSSI